MSRGRKKGEAALMPTIDLPLLDEMKELDYIAPGRFPR